MKIVCLGDSNTYGYDPRSYLGDRYDQSSCWVDILSEKLNCEIVNAGENGREVPRNSREFLAIEHMLNEEYPIDYLIIMLGTNDLLQGNPVTTVSLRMESFLRQLQLDLCNVILIAPPVLKLGEWVSSQGLIESSKDLNAAYKRLSESLGVHFVDTGNWDVPLAFDGVHLTKEGHRIFADGLLHHLRKGE